MGLFNRRTTGQTTTPVPIQPAVQVDVQRPTAETVCAEWPLDDTPDDATLGWRNGMHLYDQGVIPAQAVNTAEYLSRALKYQLHGSESLLTDQEAAETVRRILALTDRTPVEPAFWAKFAHRLIRLALTVTKLKGWQPEELGGDGTIGLSASSIEQRGLFNAAIAPGSHEMLERNFQRFFSTV